ncbi:MAG: hypothetical protein AAB706_02440 [Patescibacteria group bacterium]
MKPKLTITCLSATCPERFSLCCGAISGTSPFLKGFFCSKCGQPFVGGACTAGEKMGMTYEDYREQEV